MKKQLQSIKEVLLGCFLFSSSLMAQTVSVEAESMQKGGPYAGNSFNPFTGVALYANGDFVTANRTLNPMPGQFSVTVRGASSNGAAAGVSLEIDGVQVTTFSFIGTTASTITKSVALSGSSNKTIKLVLKTDNGSNDTFIDWISLTANGGQPTVKPAPVIPSQGAVASGNYRNMFVESGYSAANVQTKINAAFQQLFYGDYNSQKIYYPVGSDEAYILDTGNQDVRSEGMSYGMMICVQLDKQAEFNKIWKWAKNKMQHQSGVRQGHFAWQCDVNGNKLDLNAAPDAEEYIITALFFAAKRWGNGFGLFNYQAEANAILNNMMNKESPVVQSITNMFNSTEKQVVFTPIGASALHTDPSYHVPAFYEVWGVAASANNQFWRDAASKSRLFFNTAANNATGLMPEYANFNGSPKAGNGKEDFRYDAWRCIMNMAVDYTWYKKTEDEKMLSKKIHSFFISKGISTYGNQFTLNGTQLAGDHSPGLVSCNAVGSLASDVTTAWNFIDEMYNLSIPAGTYRYYDGLLYTLSLLHLSGTFKAYIPTPVSQVAMVNLLNATVFPNPSNGSLLHLNIDADAINADWTLTNSMGAAILTGKAAKEGPNEVPIQNLQPGVYHIRLDKKGQSKNIRFVVNQ